MHVQQKFEHFQQLFILVACERFSSLIKFSLMWITMYYLSFWYGSPVPFTTLPLYQLSVGLLLSDALSDVGQWSYVFQLKRYLIYCFRQCNVFVGVTGEEWGEGGMDWIGGKDKNKQEAYMHLQAASRSCERKLLLRVITVPLQFCLFCFIVD